MSVRVSWRTRRIAAGVVASLIAVSAVSADTLVVRADKLYPVSGDPIDFGVVVIVDGRIEAVGRADAVDIPEGASELRAAVATPGFIDAHSSVGLAGLENVASVLDQDDPFEADQAALRALDGFNPREPLLRHLLEHGVTLVQTGPGPATPIAGQAGIFRTVGRTADAMVVRFPSALVFNLGEVPKSTFLREKKSPSTRMGTAALIRRRLHEGLEHAASEHESSGGWFGRSEPTETYFDPGLAVLAQVATGQLPAIFTAHRADDIMTAARIIDEFSLRGAVAGGTEAYLVAAELHDADIPVLAGPVMERVSLPERQNATYENPRLLEEAGVRFAIRSGFEAYVPRNRVVTLEAGVAVANGLSVEAALRAVTLAAADLLEVADDYGSLEKGKVADVVLFDGEPFEYTTHIEAVIVAGDVVHRREPRRIRDSSVAELGSIISR